MDSSSIEPARVRRLRARSARPPAGIIALAVAGTAFFAIPFAGLVGRVPWGEVVDIVTSTAVITALRLSIITSLIATAVAVVVGVPLAWVLARMEFTGRSAVRALCTLSMVLPPVVAGVALFAAFGRRGLLGSQLDTWFGVRIPFTTTAVVLAQVFVALPFLVITVESALRQVDPRVEEAARTLGASRSMIFARIIAPAIRPALIAGAVLAWARALGEFGATITFAGNLPGTTQTLPLAVYGLLDTDPDAAIVVALAMVVISFVVIWSLRDHWFGGRATPGRSS